MEKFALSGIWPSRAHMSYLEKAGCCEQRARWNPTTEGEVGGGGDEGARSWTWEGEELSKSSWVRMAHKQKP